ncbi:MAG TPA: M1 family aminopeptidase [Polyangiaceae bacterium]|nr:M1 family aminopeptidase [Polyangiaceae bacterium]
MSVYSHRLHERCAAAGAGFGPFVLSGTERQYERSRPFRVRHLSLDLTLSFEERAVAGSAVLDVERVAPSASTITLDAVGFQIGAVRLLEAKGARDLEYDYDGDRLSIHGLEDDAARLEIVYRAVPRRGLYFLEPDRKVKDRPVQVWSQCQDEDARHWFPCHDKPHVKMTTELAVRVPSGFVALSNGDLVRTETPKKRGAPVRYHFRLDRPHPSYLVTLAVGRFAIVEDRDAELSDGRRVPIQYYVPPARRADTARSLGETPRMVELFSRLTGVPFPFSRYSQVVVHDFIFGGMENTTATTLYEHVLLDKRAAIDATSNGLVAHELAHQWFGDFVTCRDWSHAWLNEGFATYFEHLEAEDRLGREEYDYGIQGDLDSYLGEAGGRYTRAIVCRDYAEPIDLFDRHLYEKGSLVLHALRRELGDALFFRGVHEYLTAHAYGIVETNDLVRAFEAVSGRSLERFFDQWVYRPGHPELKVKVGYDDGLATVSVKQSQKTGEVAVFAFELEIEIVTASGERTRHRKTVTGTFDAISVKLDRRPAHVSVDPELRIIGNLTLEAPGDMLRHQLEHGATAFARWSAARALAKRGDVPTTEALARSLESRREAWMVRAEAARALGRSDAPGALEVLERAVSVEHPKVRRAVAAALGTFRNERAFAAVRRLAERDASYLVEAEAARALGKTREQAARPLLRKILERDSWGEVIRMGALDGLAALRDEQDLPVVLEHTRYGHPTRARRSAIAALAEVGEGRKVRRELEALLEDRDPHLRIDVINALVKFGDPRCRPALRRTLERELDGRVKRRIREALRELGDAQSERKRLADDLEAVRNELGELKARLARLEAKRSTEERPRAGTAERHKASARKSKKRAKR